MQAALKNVGSAVTNIMGPAMAEEDPAAMVALFAAQVGAFSGHGC
jgi:hypothetical protein